MVRFVLVLFLCGCAVLSGCKKETDTEPPTIELTGPSAFNYYPAIGTLVFVGEVTDDQQIDYVEFSLRNSDFQTVGTTLTRSPEGKTYAFTQGLALEDIHLETGQYYATVTADDGVNSSREWKEIYITGVPIERKSIVVVSEAVPNVTDVYTVDANDNVGLYTSFAGHHFGHAALSSYHQQLVVASNGLGNLKALNMNVPSVDWEVTYELGTHPYFQSLEFSRNTLEYTVGLAPQGEMRRYSSGGQLRGQVYAQNGYHSKSTTSFQEYVMSYEEAISGTGRILALHYRASGALHQSITMTQTVEDFLVVDDDFVYLFGNNNGQAEMLEYSVQGNSFYSPHALPSGRLNGIADAGNNSCFVAHQTGVYFYSVTTNDLLPVVTGIDAAHVAWDDVNNELWVATGAVLTVYDAAGNSLRTVNHNAPILALDVLYNK